MSVETVDTHPALSPTKSYVVGLGASAGGLEALTAVVKNLPVRLGCVYVVAQHMSATHRSLMTEILGRETTLPVLEAKHGVRPQKDTVYIVPPGANLVLNKGVFRLTKPPAELSPKPSINVLFQSIAQEYGELGIGVVLSGTGSDGTRGLLAIRAAGGLTMAQLPESAKYDGMPRSAIDAQVVDRIVTPENIGSDLERLVCFAEAPPSAEAPTQPPGELAILFSKVKDHTRIDFSSYKLSTVQRRLQRRMLACRTDHLQDYLHYVDAHPDELEALAKETLISVTEFFRDKEAFSAFERLCADVLSAKQPGDEFRAWVIGCATGEEAYSVGITLLELIRQADLRIRLHLFATDVDNDALAIARKGVYGMAAMADIPTHLLERYFQPVGEGYEPVKTLRDCVTFARQDVAADPPFLRLDVVTCRNVLIYFNNDLQSRVMSIIRNSLKDSGLLFLGRSETVSQQDNLFSVADRRARIFHCKVAAGPITIGALANASSKASSIAFVRKPARTHEQMFSQALAQFVGPAMLVDSATRILHSNGAVGKLIAFPTGSPEMILAQLIVPELSSELLSTLQRSNRGKEPVASRRRRISSLQGETWRLVIRPASLPGESNLFLVVFEEGKGRDAAADISPQLPTSAHVDLSNELDNAREQLQTLMEEMAASNEEMQALNEEIQAANEELQASNEELEAANEELQATNEELLSVNEESQVKSAALASINSEFESMYNTLDFPVLVFDTTLSLRRINGAAVRGFSMPMTHIGHHISRLKLPDYLESIAPVLEEVVVQGTKRVLDREHNGRVYQLQVNPVMSMSLSVLGVVLVTLDNTDLIDAQQRIRESQEQLAAIMQNSLSAVSLKDTAGRYEFVNRRFEELFSVLAADVVGKTDQQIFNAEQSAQLRGHDLDTMRSNGPREATERIEVRGQVRWLQSMRFQILDTNGVVRSICTESTDITDKRHAQLEQRLAAKVFDHAGEAIAVLDQEGRILRVNQSFMRITGYTSEEVQGTTMRQLLSQVQGDEFYRHVVTAVQQDGSWQGEVASRRKRGDVFPQWLTVSRVLTDDSVADVQNYVLMFSDITAIKNSQQRVEFIATHDELTGLPNRRLLTDRLKHALSIAR
ncbi:MAG: chemotaxis protein CheB [Rhodoferax sp.]|uniref:chemotaxis protein CheB n=1 Tax=Rhodoferax sp. TaxID=50421 RepID=UPI002ACDA22D|nr:chemotaxis protein CheB [Rhodoferax sp.]MDZ7892291.1 chemotaxis protein CheB [Rhodoferax sp.]